MLAATQSPRSLGFLMYREYEDGASIEELSAALHAPPEWIRERIEAVRLCLEKQVRIELRPMPRSRFNTESVSRRRSR